jgi:hypothetical protein
MKLHKKVSPPFEGGVAGSTDYLIFTKLYFLAGVVDSSISSCLYRYMENQNLFNRQSLKFFRSKLKNKSTSAEAALWNNQPPRPVSAFVS